MKIVLTAVCLICIGLLRYADAQVTNVTTLGLTTGQCVVANGASMIAPLGCSDRKNVMTVTSDITLTNTQCGLVLRSSGALVTYQITMPANPLPGCEFTFHTDVNGLYINFNGQSAILPGWDDSLTQWTIPNAQTFRTSNQSISLIWDGATSSPH